MTIKALEFRRIILILLTNLRWTLASQAPIYIPLIYDVHRHFLTSSVFLLHGNFEGLEDLEQFRDSIRLLSMEGVTAIDLDFREMEESFPSYGHRISRPLFVVVLKSCEQVGALSNITRNFAMAHPVWLLIFDNDVEAAEVRGENILRLTFDTEMLVYQTNSGNVEEWYAIRDQTRTADFATWDVEYGLVLRSNKCLYERRRNLENSTVVMIISDNPSVSNDHMHGIAALFHKMVLELGPFLNMNIEIVSGIEMFSGGNDSHEIQPSNIIGMLATGEVDIATAEFVMTTSRMMLVDFTYPLVLSYTKLYIRQPKDGVRWSGYLKIFNPMIWAAIGTSIFFTTTLLTAASGIRGNRVTRASFTNHLLLVLGVYCQQGLTEFPTLLSLRIVYLSIFISSFIIFGAYSAFLTSYLAVANPELPFSSLEGFLEDGTYRLIVFPDSVDYHTLANATNEMLVKTFSFIKPIMELPRTTPELFDQICQERVAFLGQAARMDVLKKDDLPCEIIGIRTQHTTNFAISMSKRHPFYGVLNYYLKHLVYSGIVERFKRFYRPMIEPSEKTYSKVTLSAVAPILIGLTMGIAVATAVLFLEYLHRSKVLSVKIPNGQQSSEPKLQPRRSKTQLRKRRTKSASTLRNY